MKSKTAQPTVVKSTSTGRFLIEPRRDEALITPGMIEAARKIARAVIKEGKQASEKLTPAR